MQFLHEAAGSPVTLTWTAAVKNCYFINWSGLTVDNINNNLPKLVATRREDITQAPTQEPNNAKTHMMFGAVLDEGRIYTD
eukprot:9407657-Ditylum_brightwellii.AAC.1